jgi:hypothetical protein
MPEWYELAYVYDIGPAQFVSFPRPLYPPDDPDGPVPDGPDVEAVKRIVSKLGRWPWPGTGSPPAPGFDQAYSNAFAHGKSGGNVGDSGIEGVQRQAGVAKASGAVGERTYDILLYVRIPKGLDNAGQFACDDRAIALLQQAEKIYNKPNSTPPAGNPRELIMNHHERRLGYTEQPANSNCDNRSDGIRKSQDVTAGGGTWLRYQPWCGCWVAYSYITAGVKRVDSSLASVAQIEDYAKQGAKCWRGWTTDRSKVQPGDAVVVGGYGGHVETVRGFSGSNTLTYGGNTSPGTSGSQSNGGGAYARTRYPSEVRGYALVDLS